ncbi:MAG: hypothetical protein KKD73_02965 [Proteobacteria bacterium]|nr:hypothetical protein [Pseudomonadota bacterium]MBU1638925.1 hypothetical protein [Pseudomonadota bacterium]
MPFSTANSPSGPTPVDCSGYCQRCKTHHSLGPGESRQHALALLAELAEKKRIDLAAQDSEASPLNSLDYLFGPARGQMFGVLECKGPDGTRQVLRAFSGQYNGQWQVEGWVPPLFDENLWHTTNRDPERQIKELSHQLEHLTVHDPRRKKLTQDRRTLSQQLMKELHAIYRLNNFQGETRNLKDAFQGTGGLPTGTGDCCAPKLLHYAACHQLTPLGISEFFVGRQNRSGTKKHGNFYSSCTGKCQPILGFLLCGLDEFT